MRVGLTIGEVATEVGVRTSAIRFYETAGLLPEPERRSGRRRYLDDPFSADERRPVVLLSGDEALEVRMMFVVAPATTDIRGVCIEVPVGGVEEGLPYEGVVRVALPRSGRIPSASRRRRGSDAAPRSVGPPSPRCA